VSEMVGKYWARAAPICALAAMSCCSACAMSGRRSSSCDGTPAGTPGKSSFVSALRAPRHRVASEQQRYGVLRQRDVALDLRDRGGGRLVLRPRLLQGELRNLAVLDCSSNSLTDSA